MTETDPDVASVSTGASPRGATAPATSTTAPRTTPKTARPPPPPPQPGTYASLQVPATPTTVPYSLGTSNIPTTAQPPSSITVTPPIIGGLTPTEDGRVMPWTGGEPLHDWSGPRHPASGPNHMEQHRPVTLASYLKSRVYRILALTIIFNGNMELLMQWILEIAITNVT